MTKHEKKVNKAIDYITEVYNDSSVPPSQTADSLNALLSHLQQLIAGFDNARPTLQKIWDLSHPEQGA